MKAVRFCQGGFCRYKFVYGFVVVFVCFLQDLSISPVLVSYVYVSYVWLDVSFICFPFSIQLVLTSFPRFFLFLVIVVFLVFVFFLIFVVDMSIRLIRFLKIIHSYPDG